MMSYMYRAILIENLFERMKRILKKFSIFFHILNVISSRIFLQPKSIDI